MGNRGEFYRKLRDKVFGWVRPGQKERVAPIEQAERPRKAPSGEAGIRAIPSSTLESWQIGFDFGTCFCKVAYRDVVVDKARVYIPDAQEHGELPFLIPSAVAFDGRMLRPSREIAAHYVDGRLCHLKLALEQVALGNYGAAVLQPFREVLSPRTADDLASFVKASTIYLLGGILGNVRRQILRHGLSSSSGPAPESHASVNMAIPVADAQRPIVRDAYHASLQTAWGLADTLAGHPAMELLELTRLIERTRSSMNPRVCGACFVYPEVFASIQVFVRSRSSLPGFYLFSDTGAGTVDQCICHFIRHDANPHTMYYPGPMKDNARYDAMLECIRKGQNYLRAYSAAVLPLGSAQIESLAAGQVPRDRRPRELERWRRLKESNSNDPRLQEARQQIARKLKDATHETVLAARCKGWRTAELGPIRIVFGGGGHCRDPYANAVRASIPGAKEVGLPHPSDLDLRGEKERWMTRLAVAYGLSFQKEELAKFTYPDELRDRPRPGAIASENRWSSDSWGHW